MKKKFAVFTFYKFPTLLFLTVMADTHSHTRKVPLSHTFSRSHARTSTHYTNALTHTHTREKNIFAIENYYFYSFITLMERKSLRGWFPDNPLKQQSLNDLAQIIFRQSFSSVLP